MARLSEADHKFFDEQGYLVVRGLIPKAMCDALVDGMHDFVGGDDRSLWYKPPFKDWGGLEMYQPPAMWAIRQYPPMYEVFSELLGGRKLWVSLDRCSYKLPNRPGDAKYAHEGFTHWDVDIRKVAADGHDGGVQGFVALSDVGEDGGGFQCVPGIHRRLAAFIKKQREDFNGQDGNFEGESIKQIPVKAGDVIIWKTSLAHGNAENKKDRARIGFYVLMCRITDELRETRDRRIKQFVERVGLTMGASGEGDDRGWERKRMLPVELTELGKRLLGMEDWPED